MTQWPRALVTVLFSWCFAALIQTRILNFFIFDFFYQDTFFQLSVQARIGLVILCAFLISLALLGVVHITNFAVQLHNNFTRNERTKLPHVTSIFIRLFFIIGNMITVLLILLAADYFAPQFLYTYYQLIFNSLPPQWVIGELSMKLIFVTFGLESISTLYQATTALMTTSALVSVTWTWFKAITANK